MPQEFDFNKIEKIANKPLETTEIKVEQKSENVVEQKIETVSEGEAGAEVASILVAGLSADVANEEKEQIKEIENILSEGLEEAYLSMSPAKKIEFKIMGEETAKQIKNLLSHVKVNVGKILKLIKKWLSFVPGVNRYFLEQEAKIKADKIIKIKEL